MTDLRRPRRLIGATTAAAALACALLAIWALAACLACLALSRRVFVLMLALSMMLMICVA